MTTSFNLSKKQTRAWKLLTDKITLYVGYGGGAFSGKTYLACFFLVYMCRTYPGTAWGFARRELVTLKKTSLVTLFRVLKATGHKLDEHFTYNQQLNFIKFHNQTESTEPSIIYLIDTAYAPSDPNYDRFGGYELTGCVVDESAESDRRAIEILFTRLGRCLNSKYGITKKMLECFNSSKAHVYDRYYLPWKEGNEPEHKRFILAKPTDNPAPEVESYVRDIMLTADKTTIERLINANFDYEISPLSLLPNYDSICNVFTNAFVKPTGKRFLSGDIAYLGADLFVITIWDGWVVKKVISIDKIDETAIGNKLIQLANEYEVPFSNIVYDADGLRKFTANSLKKLTTAKPFNNAAAPVKDKKYANIKTECAYVLKAKIENNEMYIEDQEFRKQILNDLEQMRLSPTEDEGKVALEKKSEHKKRTGVSPGYFDSLIMRCYFEIKQSGGWA
jgi:phage terminase large subunit